MAVYFAAPTFRRAGVVAGFVLSAPDYAGVAQMGDTRVSFRFYVDDVTVKGTKIKIDTGYSHYITIGTTTYSYVQQTDDAEATVAAALTNLINGTPDVLAAATNSGAFVTLQPRRNSGAEIACSASDGNDSALLEELTGSELVPSITMGVLFAQGTMFRPSQAPTLPAATASRKSYLYYSSTNGWYWLPGSTPTASDDACVGWVVTNATQVIAVSSRRIGTGDEASIVPSGAVAVTVGTSGDTGLPSTPFFGAGVASYGQVELSGLSFEEDAENVDGITAVTFILYYIDELSVPARALTAALAAAGTAMSASATLPASAGGAVSFTFYSTTTGGVTIGPGYRHNITIGALTYAYTQQTSDTAADVAAELVEAINAGNDPNATASASGATVTLAAKLSTGAEVVCTASDGNTTATLVETMPAYVWIGGEVIQVKASNGSAIVRGCKGSTAKAHAAGALVWTVETMTVSYAVSGLAWGTTAWPDPVGVVPFRAKALCAADCWVTNEYGDSATYTAWFGSNDAGRLRALTGGQIALTVDGVLGIESSAVPAARLSQAASVRDIFAVVDTAPTGSSIGYTVKVGGTAVAALTIAAGAIVSGSLSDLSTPSVEGLVIPANTDVTLDVTSVGTTYPGKRLRVFVRI